jgi:cytochrome c oxidase assembly factor CtaG
MLLQVAMIAWRSTCWLPLLTSVLDFSRALDICLLLMASFVLAGSLLFYCCCRSRLILHRLATCFDDHRLGSSSIQFLVVIGLAWLAFGRCLFPVFVISCKISLCYQDAPLSCLLLCVRLGTLFLVPLITIVCFYANFTF